MSVTIASVDGQAEEWRPVVGYEGLYEVSDLGRVRGLRFSRAGRPFKNVDGILVQDIGNYGYPFVRMTKHGQRRTMNVHRLVLEAFVGPKPDGMMTRHLNGDHTDNRLVNLAYGTNSENVRDAVRHGTHHETRKTHCPQGHPYDDENTRISKLGHRLCRTCQSEHARKTRARKKIGEE